MKKILICLFFLFISLMSCLSQTTFMIDSCRFVNEILASAPTCTIENVSNGIIVYDLIKREESKIGECTSE